MSKISLLQNENKSLLIINREGKLIRLYCPFPVKNNKGDFFTVIEISNRKDGFLYYKIDCTYYIYSLFFIHI